MVENRVKKILDEGGVCLGTFIALPVPAIVEMVGHAGYDFVVIDMEHTALSVGDAEHLIRAAEATGITPFVRVPKRDWRTAARVVELGVGGIMAPHIDTARDAADLVATVKYPPLGSRGVNVTTRASNYGAVDVVEHVRRANEQVLAIVLIEERAGIENADEIMAVPGVDIAITGPADLSRSYGVPGQIRHELVEQAIERFMKAAADHGKPTMRAAFDPADVATHVRNGIRLVTSPLNDAHFLSRGLREAHTVARRAVAEAVAGDGVRP